MVCHGMMGVHGVPWYARSACNLSCSCVHGVQNEHGMLGVNGMHGMNGAHGMLWCAEFTIVMTVASTIKLQSQLRLARIVSYDCKVRSKLKRNL
jgi:hypothetical protein